jgi:hypothetical protein
MVAQALSWQQFFTGLQLVQIQGVNKRRADKKRVVALKELGTTVCILSKDEIIRNVY